MDERRSDHASICDKKEWEEEKAKWKKNEEEEEEEEEEEGNRGLGNIDLLENKGLDM